MTAPPPAIKTEHPTVVIIGGTSGFGAALARSLARRGAAIVLTGRNRQRAEEAARSVGARDTLGLGCEIQNPEHTDAVWQAAVDRFGTTDHWIINAGIGHAAEPLSEVAPDDLGKVITTNLTGALISARCAVTGMTRQGGGRIWMTEGLGSGNVPVMPGTIAYSASKAGLTRASQVLAAECRNTPVRVSLLRPAIMPTGLTTKNVPEEQSDQRTNRMVRLLSARPDEVAEAFAPRILRAHGRLRRLNWASPRHLTGHLLHKRWR